MSDSPKQDRIDEVMAEVDRILAEELNGITAEQAEQLAGKSSDEIDRWLREFHREREAVIFKRLAEAFQLEEGTDGDQPDE